MTFLTFGVKGLSGFNFFSEMEVGGFTDFYLLHQSFKKTFGKEDDLLTQ